MNRPEALEFADYLKCGGNYPPFLEDIAVELERQHGEIESMRAENKLLHERHHDDNVEYTRVLAQRDALLEALREAEPFLALGVRKKARAAIKAVEENPHT